jgi:hypothetical protein
MESRFQNHALDLAALVDQHPRPRNSVCHARIPKEIPPSANVLGRHAKRLVLDPSWQQSLDSVFCRLKVVGIHVLERFRAALDFVVE